MRANTIPEWPLHYRVRLALDVADVDTAELAEQLGVHPNTVTNYCAGRTRPRRATLRIISQMTGVSLRWLETGDDSDDGTDEPGVTALVTSRYLQAA